MANLTYGTPEYYAEMFADILTDVDATSERPYADNIIEGFYRAADILADVDATSERPYADNIIEGFYRALEDWFNYHDA